MESNIILYKHAIQLFVKLLFININDMTGHSKKIISIIQFLRKNLSKLKFILKTLQF